MTFDEFVQVIMEEITDYLLQYDVETIHINDVKKNNGVGCTGMSIIVKEKNISPNIYLDYYYSLYLKGKGIEDILILIAKEYVEAMGNIGEMEKEMVTAGMNPNNVFLRLVNYERNKEVISYCPHIKFHDLAITFRCLFETEQHAVASCLIRDEDMGKWDISQEELFNIARKNTIKMFPPKIKKLEDMLAEMLIDKEGIPRGDNLYVLTNEQGVNGATYLLYDEIIKQFAEHANSNVFILPSSIHEVLLLPDDGQYDKDELQDMVREINRYVVSPVDYLSDNVYIYDIEKEDISY